MPVSPVYSEARHHAHQACVDAGYFGGRQRSFHAGSARCMVLNRTRRPNTGPLNGHFIRDIGAAFLVSGGALVWFACDARARPAAVACAAFFVLHAIVHLSDAMTGRESMYQAVRDLPTVYLGALLTLWIAWPRPTPAKEEVRDAQMVVTAADRRLRKGR